MRVLILLLAFAAHVFAQPKVTLNPFTGKFQYLDNAVAGCTVDLATAPSTDGHVLTYIIGTGKCVWAAPPGAGGGEANTGSNVGAAGIGVFHQKAGTDLEFRKLTAGSTKITLVQADTNRQIVFDVDPAQFSLATIGLAGTSLPVNRLAAQTASRALVTDSSGFLAPSAVTSAELGYVAGVSSAIQTQLNDKVSLSGSYITPAWLVGINPSIIGTGTITNSVTFGGGSSLVATGSNRTAPVRAGTTPPGTCNDSDMFIDTDASATQSILYCRANTWYPQGTGGTAAWGSITGTLSAQTDLQTALDAKAATTIPVLTTTAVAGLSAESNLGALADNNVLAVDVSAGTATPRAATVSDLVALWTTCGSAYMRGNGTCDTPSGGSGATAVAGLSDNKVTVNSTIYTVAAGSVPCLDTSGVMQSYPISAGTVERTTGTTAGTIKFGYSCNGGSPIYVARIPVAITLANYNCTGVTCTSSDTYAEGDWALADAVVGGSLGTPTDRRSLGGTARYTGQNGVTISGNTASANCAYVDCLGTAATHTAKKTFGPDATNAGVNVGSVAGDPSAPVNGDLWYDSTAHELTARINGANVAWGAGGGAWGSITGTLSSQTDLQAALDAKLPLAGGTLTGQLVTDNLGVEFDESDTNPTCAAGNYNIFADTSETKLKKCQNGVATDLDTGGTPGGSTTHVQFNNAGAFGGDAGLAWDNTNKLLSITRSNSGAAGGRLRAYNSAGLSLNQTAIVESCIEYTNDCAQFIRGYYNNADGLGSNYYWSQIRTVVGSSYYNVIGRRAVVDPVHIGGDADTSLGWFSVAGGGVTRFANANTAGRGLVSIAAAPTNLTGQTGDVAAYNLMAASHTAGTYRVCGALSITTTLVASMSSWSLTWRDLAVGSDVTNNIVWDNNGTLTGTPSTGTATGISMVCKVINSAGTSAISINPGDVSTAAYTSAFTVEWLK